MIRKQMSRMNQEVGQDQVLEEDAVDLEEEWEELLEEDLEEEVVGVEAEEEEILMEKAEVDSVVAQEDVVVQEAVEGAGGEISTISEEAAEET